MGAKNIQLLIFSDSPLVVPFLGMKVGFHNFNIENQSLEIPLIMSIAISMQFQFSIFHFQFSIFNFQFSSSFQFQSEFQFQFLGINIGFDNLNTQNQSLKFALT